MLVQICAVSHRSAAARPVCGCQPQVLRLKRASYCLLGSCKSASRCLFLSRGSRPDTHHVSRTTARNLEYST
jgi:hypothetical protein